jgi:adenosylcobinamide-GDP ribazoletransferase
LNRYLQEFIVVLGFFTRLPVHRFMAAPNGDWRNRLAEVSWAFPVVGAVIGGAGAIVYVVATMLGLGPMISAALVVASQVLITGALHEDGLSDVADGFGGGATKERKLEIMRDSRVGAYGVVAIVLALLLRVGALAEVEDIVLVLIAAGAASRAAMVAAMAILPAARADGLGASAGQPPGREFFIALGVAAVISWVLLGAGATIIAGIATGLAWLTICKLAEHQIGGQTGDVLGSCQQICEIVFLLAMVGYVV